MNTNNNNIRNIYIKNSRPYNQKSKNFNPKNNLIYEDNITEKNNIIFVKSNLKENEYSKEKNKTNQKIIPKKYSQNKNNDFYFDKNQKKKILNENMNIFLDNITKDDNPMTIHNINLINSMNNITFYDSIPNIKKDILKYPLNKFNSQTYNTNKNYNIKNNSPKDFKLNNKSQNNNIIVNKNKLFMENKSSTNIGYNSNNYKFKNNSLSKKKMPFIELNYKKLNLSGNNKNITKFNKGNNFTNFNTQENNNLKNNYQYIEYESRREGYQDGNLAQSKNININNSTNKRLSKESLINRNNSPKYNTYSNCMNSIDEEEINKKKKRMILDKVNNNRHIINVNKLENFKINDNYKISDNNSNNKNISNHNSNIFSLLSNKNIDNYNKSKLDKENLNKIKKNINNENYYQTNYDNIKIEENNNNKVKKTKSLGKIYKNNKDNKDNKDLSKKMKIFTSILNDNNINNNITNYNSKKNNLRNTSTNNDFNNGNNISTYNNNKYFYSTFNPKNSPKSLIQMRKRKSINNITNYNIEIPQINKMNKNNNNNKVKEKHINNNSNILDKIEVNKTNLSKKHNKSLNMKQFNNIQETRNESLNLYEKKTFQESLMNNLEKNNSFSKNTDNYLSNYKEKKEKNIMKYTYSRKKSSSPKKTFSNIIYNKKQFLSHIKKEKESLEEKIVSPDSKQRKVDKIFDKKCINEELNDISKIKNENIEDESINYNYIFNENEIIDNISEKNINYNITNKNSLMKSPVSTIYKKPGITFFNSSNSSIVFGKDSNNKLPLYSSEINEKQIVNENYLNNSKKKDRKIYLNVKLNKFSDSKEFLNDNNNSHNKRFKKNRVNINLNNINYEEGELLPKLKGNILIKSINSYKSSKNKEINCSNGYIINNEQFTVKKINKKVYGSNSFISKYFNYYINYNNNKIEKNKNCYISKIRLNKKDLISYEIPLKKLCYFSKKRKFFATIIPKVDICCFKKVLINRNNYIKKINNNNHFIDDDNLIINNEFYLNKKDNEDFNDIKFNNHQYSFTSINSIENGNNYFEISFGKKVNKSIINNENKINNLNNNNINLKRFIPTEKHDNQENKINPKTDNENLFLNNNLDKAPSKIYIKNKINYKINNKSTNNDNINLKKTEKGLKLLEKIAGNRILPTSPTSNKNNNFLPNNNNNKENVNTITIENKNNNSYHNIKNDFIEKLNIITINNFDLILNSISNLILNNNIITIDNISQLLYNQNLFIEIIINKAMTEKKYIKIYAKLCKDLFITLMTIIDNYNDDMDIFNKISKDKSLKVILKNKIFEKINHLNFENQTELKKNDINNLEKDSLYYELKTKFINLIYFFRELLEIKLISSKKGFEILDILYQKYNNNINKIIYKDLYLEGIEILLSILKIIIYEKNNLEYIQRYNKFIKNNLNNIFINRKKRNDLPKYLYYKLLNLIESHKKEEKLINISNNKNRIPIINEASSNNKNEYIILKNNNYKINSLIILVENPNSNNNNISNRMMEIIKKDIEKFILEPNIDQIKNTFFNELNRRYNEELNIKKTIEIWEIFYYYIEACIDLVNNEEKIYIVNEYIENIINNFAIDIPKEIWEMLHYKLISLFLNINEICSDNKYMHQIMGYLLFLLINNKLFFIKDLNNFLNKDNEIIINISKAVKYTIICADKDAKKYHNDFKQTKLFIGNDAFYNIVTKPLSKKFYF